MSTEYEINTLDELDRLYGDVNPNSLAKETASLTPEYRRWIEASPFFAVATSGPGGLDCSPRGDPVGQLFRVLSDREIVIPDRRGNNRRDTLKNIISDPHIALLFLMPGINETLRINGQASITTDPDLRESFAVKEKLPVTVIRVKIDSVYFQCARALIRSQLWNSEHHATRDTIPTTGQMTKSAISDFDADSYDAALLDRQKSSLY